MSDPDVLDHETETGEIITLRHDVDMMFKVVASLMVNQRSVLSGPMHERMNMWRSVAQILPSAFNVLLIYLFSPVKCQQSLV